MSDPFNFESLRQQTPKYLGLDSLRESLPTPTEGPNEGPFLSYEDEDISMVDQSISESDLDLEDPAPSTAKPLEDPVAVSKSTGLAVADSEPAAQEKPPSGQNDDAHSAHKVLSPTQFGAHWALDTPQQHRNPEYGYGYEIRMPIPAPWHENLPYTLSTYLQLLFNLGVGLVGVWLVLVAKRDVSAIIRERSDEIAFKASWCQQQYIVNRCSPDSVVPHLVDRCLELERCMDRDPDNLRWLSVHASLLSEVLNALIEPLTIRTMISLAGLTVATGFLVFMINYLFGFWRARAYFLDTTTRERKSPPSDGKHLHISAVPHRPGLDDDK